MNKLAVLVAASALVVACKHISANGADGGPSNGDGSPFGGSGAQSGAGGGAASGGGSFGGSSSGGSSMGGSPTGGSFATGGLGGSSTGGSSSGGSSATGGFSTGGSSTGGSSSGGSSATGGSATGGSSSGGSGGSLATAQCTTDAQCTLHSDCCNCLALAPGEQAPSCNVTSCQSGGVCAELGITQADAACVAGVCNAGIDCNPVDVDALDCLAVEPSCATGQVASVIQATHCWGPCVLATECSEVEDCNDCDTATALCVSIDAQTSSTLHCVPVPAPCQSDRSCTCLGSAVCLAPTNLCTHFAGTDSVDCTCPSC
jgi:hypothetical protein